MPKKPKVYLAGPDIFRRDALVWAEKQKEICARYNVEPLHPMDNNLNPDKATFAGAQTIYNGDIGQVLDADAICANFNMFRGPEPDSGTVYELAFMAGMNQAIRQYGIKAPLKPLYGYVDAPCDFFERVIKTGHIPAHADPENTYDRDGMKAEPFADLTLNLMLEVPMRLHGAFVNTGFEDCIAKLSADWYAGKFAQSVA